MLTINAMECAMELFWILLGMVIGVIMNAGLQTRPESQLPPDTTMELQS